MHASSGPCHCRVRDAIRHGIPADPHVDRQLVIGHLVRLAKRCGIHRALPRYRRDIANHAPAVRPRLHNPSRSPGLAGENAVVATLPALSAAETRAAEALLARAWGPGTSVRAAEPIWDRSHVVRLHLATGRSVVMKKRAGKDTFGAELGALEYLNGMPEPVAPRLLGADADAGILLMEDLGPGPSLADSLLTGDRSRVRADLVSYAEALGSMHAWSMGRPRDPRLGTPPWPDAVARGKDAFLGRLGPSRWAWPPQPPEPRSASFPCC